MDTRRREKNEVSVFCVFLFVVVCVLATHAAHHHATAVRALRNTEPSLNDGRAPSFFIIPLNIFLLNSVILNR